MTLKNKHNFYIEISKEIKMKPFLLITLLSLFFVSGCADKKQKYAENYKNNDDVVIHYIGDQSVFEN